MIWVIVFSVIGFISLLFMVHFVGPGVIVLLILLSLVLAAYG